MSHTSEHTPGPKMITVAISPCPNDTFVFAGWILGRVGELPGLSTRFLWEDVQDLNLLALRGQTQVTKVSAAQALRLETRCRILSAGAAFGLEHGPRLVARPGRDTLPRTIAVPGLQTTACALLQAALGDHSWRPVPMEYDRIIQAVSLGQVEAGLLIHESALVYQRYGFRCLLDIGQWWREKSRGLPLPLGCIVIDKSLGTTVPAQVQELIRSSLSWSHGHREETTPLLTALAQELDASTLEAHVSAYVNDLSFDMGEAGLRALACLRDLIHTT